jgi:RHS repeat-associated protein
VYDGDGNRLQKTENSITTIYIHSGINSIYEENSTGSTGYIYGPIGLMARRTTINQESNTYFYHKDHLGSTRSVTDSSKNIITASTYHPFGETEVEEGSEYYLYNGKERDSAGLYYYGARYYDPQIGKFITRDLRIGRKKNSQSTNRYTYCLNNPIKYIDPDGFGEKFSYLKTNPNPVRMTTRNFLLCLGLTGGLVIALIVPGGAHVELALLGVAGSVGLGVGFEIINDVLLPQSYYEFMENIDDDEAWEIIIREVLPEGEIRIDIIDDDGTIYRTIFDSEGNEIERLKKVPDPDNPGKYLVYIWDYNTKSYKLKEENNEEEPGGTGGGGGGNKIV